MQSNQKYKIPKGCVYNVRYFLTWTPKRKAKVLKGNIVEDLKELIFKHCENNEIKIDILQIGSSFVSLTVTCHPKISPHLIIKKLKAASSNCLRQKYPELLKLPCLWSGAYLCETIGYPSESFTQHFLEKTKG